MGSSAQTVAELGEAELLRRIARLQRGVAPGVRVGIGDDAAVLAAVGPEAVLSADMLIEDVDFRLRWASWADVGHKAAAANLSDLAAMGATPRGLLLSLALRPDDRVADVLALVRAVGRVGARYGAALVGGDLSATRGPLVVSITAIGQVRRGRGLRRGLGEVGDLIAVTGSLGGAAAGLAALERGELAAPSWRARQLRPVPRVEVGLAIAERGLVRSAADISDGLVRDVLHVVRPGLGVVLDAAEVPLARGLDRDAEGLRLALAGGEDFELVLAVEPGTRARRLVDTCREKGVAVAFVGQVSRKRGVRVVNAPALRGLPGLRGFEHFVGRPGRGRAGGAKRS